MIAEHMWKAAISQRKERLFRDQVLADGGTVETDFTTWYKNGNGMARTYGELYMMAGARKTGVVYGMNRFGSIVNMPFARMSSATRHLKNGSMELAAQDVPRIQYNYSTGDGHLLLEPAATNTYTNAENSTGWGDGGCIISNVTGTIVPSGNGVKFAAKATAGQHGVFKTLSATFPAPGNTVSFSFYIKASGYNGALFIFYDRGSVTGTRYRAASLNLSTGAVLSNNKLSTETLTVTDCGNSWWRVTWENWATQATSSFNASAEFYVASTPQANLNAQNFTGDGTSGCTVTGIQVETGPVCTSYIPTTAATVTRSADSLNTISNMLAAGYSFTDRGTLYYRGGYQNLAAAPIISLKDNTGTVKAELKANSSNVLFMNDAVQATNSANTIAATYPRSLALRWGAAGTHQAINGNLYAATTEAAAYAIDQVTINGVGTYGGIHRIKELALLPYGFTDTQLQTLGT